MITNDSFAGIVARWLEEDADHRVVDHLDEVLVLTAATRQRSRWSSLGRWLPGLDSSGIAGLPAARLVYVLLLIGLLIVMFVLALLGAGRPPQGPDRGQARNGSIAIVQGEAILIADADGTNLRELVAPAVGATAIQWSPDGSRIAFRTARQPSSIVVIDADGRHPVTVSGGGAVVANDQLSWSPDGRQLVFSSLEPSGGGSLYVAAVDGSGVRRLGGGTSTTQRSDPAWSPDGRWIAFVVTIPGGEPARSLFVVHPSGGGERLVADPVRDETLFRPTWAPDARRSRLLYVSRGDVRIADLDTSRDALVWFGYWPTWSGDGSRVGLYDHGTMIVETADAFADLSRFTRPYDPYSGLCEQSPRTTGPEWRLCSPAIWSPDSAALIGLDSLKTTIVLVRVDGSRAPTPIGDPGSAAGLEPSTQLAWQPIWP